MVKSKKKRWKKNDEKTSEPKADPEPGGIEAAAFWIPEMDRYWFQYVLEPGYWFLYVLVPGY